MMAQKIYKVAAGMAAVTVAIAFVFANHGIARAQQAVQGDPAVILFSWRSGNQVPAWYMGKSLTTYQAPMFFAITVIGNTPLNQGKIINMADREIRWYVNDQLASSRDGRQTFTLTNPMFQGGDLSIRVSANVYDPVTRQDLFIDGYYTFQTNGPEVHILRGGDPFAPVSVSGGQTAFFTAAPFFFHHPDDQLNVRWTLNGNAVSNGSNPLNLSVAINKDSAPGLVTAGVTIDGDSGNFPEEASSQVNFSIH
jgi:hypothetical protein